MIVYKPEILSLMPKFCKEENPDYSITFLLIFTENAL
jgi:hypothetical protein